MWCFNPLFWAASAILNDIYTAKTTVAFADNDSLGCITSLISNNLSKHIRKTSISFEQIIMICNWASCVDYGEKEPSPTFRLKITTWKIQNRDAFRCKRRMREREFSGKNWVIKENWAIVEE